MQRCSLAGSGTAPAAACYKARSDAVSERWGYAVAVGRFTSDLDQGDVLGPVDYVMSKFVVREYCHSIEMHQPCFQGRVIPFAPPTLVHLNKLRLYRHACPGGTGPRARIHIEYDATIHAAVPVGVPLRVQGTVAALSGLPGTGRAAVATPHARLRVRK